MVSGKAPARKEYYDVLAKSLPANALVVTALGNASYLWSVICDRDENFYFEDAMGLALPLAVGLATAQPKRPVVVVEGDGGLLMHMGALITAGAVAPKNLTILLIQNGVHAASGGQTLTNTTLDFATLAGAAGLDAENIATPEAFGPALTAALARQHITLLALQTEPDVAVETPCEQFDVIAVKRRFEKAIGARRYVRTMFGGGMLSKP